jgi:hypothetical protein
MTYTAKHNTYVVNKILHCNECTLMVGNTSAGVIFPCLCNNNPETIKAEKRWAKAEKQILG